MNRHAIIIILTLLTGTLTWTSLAAAQEQPRRMAGGVECVEIENAVDAPMLWRGPQPVVEVFLNEQGPYRFAIDTGGAGAGRVDVSLQKRMSLPVVGAVRAGDPSGQNVREVDVVRAETLRIGAATFRGVEMSVGDYNRMGPGLGEPIDGIIGFGLFEDLLLTLDFPGERVRIERGSLGEPDGASLITFSAERGVPVAPVRVGGVDTEATLDTGNLGALHVSRDLAKRLKFAEEPRVLGRARTQFNEFEIMGATIDGALEIGDARVESPLAAWSEVLGDHTNVGVGALKSLRLTFDQRGGVMRIESAQKKAPAK